jgi:sulfur carrier protein ThiS
MIVHVRLHTTLRKETPQGIIDRVDLELDPGATVADVLTRLEIQPRGGSVIMEVNGNLAKAGHVLQDGDRVRLVPSVSGGRAQA